MQNSVAKKLFAVGSAVAMTVSLLAPMAAHAAVHAAGTNVVSSDGTVWMIMPDGTRRAYTSAGAFLSYGFNSWASVVPASSEDLALAAGSYIPPQDGSIICSDRNDSFAVKGTCYVISGGMKNGITSAPVFLGLGYLWANSSSADVSWMTPGAVLLNSSSMAHLPGTLVNNNGTVQLVGNGGVLGIPDVATFNSWGYSFGKVVFANAADKAMVQNGVMATRQPGQLSPTALTNPSCTVNCTPVVISGPISASLAYDNPAAGSVVGGQAAADFAHFTFTGNGTVASVTLQRTGVTANTALTNVYLFQGNRRITDAASVNTSGQIVFANVNLPVNGSVTVSARGDVLSSLNSGSIGLSLTSYTTTGNSPSTVNIAGNLMNVVSGSGVLAGVTFTTASLTPTGTPTVNAGSTAYTFWSIPLSVTTHAVLLKGANFQVIGSAPTDSLSNIQLYVNGVPAGSPSTVVNGYVFFDLSSLSATAPCSLGSTGICLQTGSVTIEVRANVQKGSNRTVQFALQNAADFTVVDSQLNVGIAPAVTAGTFTPLSAASVTISAGTLTAVIDSSFQSLTNVTGGGTNQVIGRYKLHAYGEDVKISTLVVDPTVSGGSPATDQLNNVTLYFGPSVSSLGQVGSSQTYSGTNLTFTLGSSLVAPAGTDSYLEVRADVQNNANTNYTSGTLTTSLVFGSSTGQGMSSLNTTSVLPSSSLTTSGLTIQTGTLTVGKSSYANQTLNPNQDNQKIGEFTLQNQSTSESIRVTNLAVNLTSDGSTALIAASTTNYSSLRTDEASGSGTTPINPSATNNFSVNFTIAPGASKTIGIWANLSTAATGSLVVTLLPTAYGLNSNVTLTPSSATIGQTITLASGTITTPTFNTSQSSPTQFVASAAGGTAATTNNAFNFTGSNGTAIITELKFVIASSTGGAVTSISIPNGNGTNTVSAPVVTPATTTLSTAATTTSMTSINVGSASNLVVGSVISISSSTGLSEDMLVTAISGTALTVTRAVNGTTANTFITGSSVLIRGMADITGLSISVPNGQGGIYVNAMPTYAAVGTNGITSGSLAQLSLTYERYSSGGSTTAQAITPVTANNMNLVGSKPVLSVTNTNNSGLVIGENHLFDLTVTPDSHGPVQLNSMVFTVSTTTAVSALSATRLAIGSNTISGSSCAQSGAGGLTVTCTLPSNYVLTPLGGAQTFTLFGTLASSAGLGSAGTSSVTVVLAAASNFNWTDTAGGGSAVTTANTTYFYNYPTQTWSIHN